MVEIFNTQDFRPYIILSDARSKLYLKGYIMVCIDTFNSVDNVRYDVSRTHVICKVQMQDGTIKKGIANVEERINVFGYFIPLIEDAKICALENALLNTRAV